MFLFARTTADHITFLTKPLRGVFNGGDHKMIFSCVLFFFWFFSALFKASK
nr:MAG TPA: hypothetical protein [Bacteriophage sp.]